MINNTLLYGSIERVGKVSKKVFLFLGAMLLFLSLDGQTVVTLHLPLPCTETSSVPHFDASPLELDVLPNPTSGELTLVASGQDIIGDLYLEVSSIQGKTMMTEQFASSENHFSKTVDLKHLASGVYLLKLTSKDAVVTKKIVIQK